MSFRVIQGDGQQTPPRTDGLFGVDRDTYAWWTQPRVTSQPMSGDVIRKHMGSLYWRIHGPTVIDGGKP